MCDLTRMLLQTEAIVYKLAAIHRGRYYSVAMGFRYPVKGKVPIPKKQERITSNWMSNILQSSLFRESMVGRTAGYIELGDAKRALARIQDGFFDHHWEDKYTIVIVKVCLKQGLMVGTYYDHGNVIAGKYIESMKEVMI